MVIVTHEMSFAREVANKVVFMDDGKIIEQGSPVELSRILRSQGQNNFWIKFINNSHTSFKDRGD